MRPAVAFGTTSAAANSGVDADADVDMGASDENGENDGTGSSGIAHPEGETIWWPIPLVVC